MCNVKDQDGNSFVLSSSTTPDLAAVSKKPKARQ